MLLENERIVVMGLLNADSIAWLIGQAAVREGAQVIYTVQNERYCNTVLLKSFRQKGLSIADYNIYECDVENDEDIARLFKKTGKIDGLVYSIAYASRECLSGNLYDAPREQILKSYNISTASFPLVIGKAQEKMPDGSSIIALTFESQKAFPSYNWMGVNKAGLEAAARSLALDLKPRKIRVNCLSSGPLNTKAATSIPGHKLIIDSWSEACPDWDVEKSRDDVAEGAIYLLGEESKDITGEILYVDGGFHEANF